MIVRETIAAISTPHGKSAIGIIRVSGQSVPLIIKEFIGPELTPRMATHTQISDTNGSIIDDVVAIYYKNPRSYTGEDMLEIQSHGNPVILDAILETICNDHARISKPGEFTERAFLNNKIDLIQAESIADLINASHISASKAAMITLQGNFSNKIKLLVEDVIKIRANIEACINFPEDDSPAISNRKNLEAIDVLILSLTKLVESVDNGIALNKSPVFTIIGKPNVGKSSLANSLLGDTCSIVSDAPGTTRDALHHNLILDKNNITIIDTAGLRTTNDNIELQGIDVAIKSIKLSTLVLYVVDDEVGFDKADEDIITDNNIEEYWIINNKIDLTQSKPGLVEKSGVPNFYVSTTNNLGLQDLINGLSNKTASNDETTGTARLRHLELLLSSLENLYMAKKCNDNNRLELVAEELRLAHTSLVAIMGGDVTEDLLDKIFSEFCIGK